MSAPVCVLVRSHDPTPAQAERVGEWLCALEHTEFVMYVSVDVSAPATAAKALARLARHVPANRIHTYTEADMLGVYGRSLCHFLDPQTFPGTESARTTFAGRRQCGTSLAWGFHVEAIGLWAHQVNFAFSHVWVLEDDVGFSGDIAAFLRQYSHDPADLITNRITPTAAGTWGWHDTCTPAYACSVPPGRRYTTNEHVMRFSARLLSELDRLSRIDGISAWSEQFVVSIVMQPERQFSATLFWPEHVGSPFKWDGRILSREEWAHICMDDQRARSPISPIDLAYMLPAIVPTSAGLAPTSTADPWGLWQQQPHATAAYQTHVYIPAVSAAALEMAHDSAWRHAAQVQQALMHAPAHTLAVPPTPESFMAGAVSALQPQKLIRAHAEAAAAEAAARRGHARGCAHTPNVGRIYHALKF